MGEEVVMWRLALGLGLCLGLSACETPRPRPLSPPLSPPTAKAPVPVVPHGYAARLMAECLEDPRAVAMGPNGGVYVVEGVPASLLRIDGNGSLVPLATGGADDAWTGGAFVAGRFAVAGGGRIFALTAEGKRSILVEGLPAATTIALEAGPDGWLYAAVSSVAAGPAGPGRDIPCQDLDLRPGGSVKGRVPCTNSVLRIAPDGATVEAFAWGFGRPVGLDFTADGRLMLAESGLLWTVTPGVWYGWPDYHGQMAMADPLLAATPNPPPAPLAVLPGPARAMAVARGDDFGPPGEVFVALDDGTVAFIDPAGAPTPFVAGLSQPSAMAFSEDGAALWVADAGTGQLWRIEAVPGAP
jgi:glucose/arabinose dehydrogenase